MHNKQTSNAIIELKHISTAKLKAKSPTMRAILEKYMINDFAYLEYLSDLQIKEIIESEELQQELDNAKKLIGFEKNDILISSKRPYEPIDNTISLANKLNFYNASTYSDIDKLLKCQAILFTPEEKKALKIMVDKVESLLPNDENNISKKRTR